MKEDLLPSVSSFYLMTMALTLLMKIENYANTSHSHVIT